MGIELVDTLYLADGTAVTGVIMEIEPGKTVTIETEDRQLFKYKEKDIERIEKRIEDIEREALIQNRDIVYLKDGVVFKGMVVGQVPGESIRLELESGLLLDFQLKEIVKISKEQVSGGIVKRAPLTPKKSEKEKIDISVQIMQDRLAQARSRAEEQEDGSEEEQKLEEEVDRLKEEMEALEQEQQRIEEEAVEEQAQIARVGEELGEVQGQLLERAAEIEEMIEACSSPQLRQSMSGRYAEIQSKVAELMQRIELVSLVEQPDPRIQEIEAEKNRTELIALAENRLWNKAEFKDEFEERCATLTEKQRRDVYREARRTDVLGPTLRNLAPFVAWGSWKQQDYLGASIAMASTIGGLVVFTAGTELNWFSESMFTFGAASYIGIGLMAAGYVFSLVEPFIFVARSNLQLSEALGVPK